METNSPFFTLVIDEERCKLLQLMMGMTHRQWADYAEAMPEDAEALDPVMLSLLKEVSEKMHERGWCKDPNCEDK